MMRHKAVWLGVMAFLVVSLGLLFSSSKAFAAGCPSGPIIAFGRSSFCGYFSNKYDDGGAPNYGKWVLNQGVHVNSEQSFINTILSYYNSGSKQDHTGAAFIIDTMDPSYCSGRSPSASCLSDWENRVQAMADGTTGSVNWNESMFTPCGQPNTYYQSGGNNDDAPYPNNSSGGCGQNNNVIVFRKNDKNKTIVYEIRIQCGNPLGTLPGLPVAPPPPKPHCDGATINPAAPDPNATFTITASINYTPAGSAARALKDGDKLYIVVNGPGITNATRTPGMTNRNDVVSGTGTFGPSHAGGTYTITWSMRNGATTKITCKKTFTITALSCGSATVNPATPVSTQTYDITANVLVAPASQASTIKNSDKMFIYVNGIGVNRQDNNAPTTVNGGTITGKETNWGPTNNGGTYTITWGMKNGATVKISCTKQFNVVALNCNGVSTKPSPLDPLTPFTITASVRYNPPSGVSLAANEKMFIHVTGPWTYTNNNVRFSEQPPGSGIEQGTVSNIGPTRATGTFDITYGMMDSAGKVILNCPTSGPFQFTVTDLPYFSVKDGDIQSGDCMQNGGATPTGGDSDGSIVSWNQEAAGNYAGAGVQYAAFALGYLQDFPSAQNKSPGTYLSFANKNFAGPNYIAGSNSGQDTYGGGYISYQSCATDYYGTPTTVQPSGYTINGQMIPNTGAGSHQIIYVNGNVYIKGSITYSGNYASVQDIPSFTVVAKGGNIYIDKGVAKLDGLYVAEPNATGAGGTIYDCATGPTTGASLNSSLFSTCHTSLTVNGSFVARQLELQRTTGTLHSNPAAPAETFDYNPEIWLTEPTAGGSAGTSGDDAYDAITSLPPAL